MKVCAVPDCRRQPQADGYCATHSKSLAWVRGGGGGPPTSKREPGPAPLAMFPSRPQRITDALAALAESRPTPAEYERRKREILRGATP